ncbi:methyltransferase (plasmid) [Robbsia andropogonis]|uniref:methyltransferase n=1 Tax=Robbsia andropogonis TaxID=28092 RepID=UPI003D244507
MKLTRAATTKMDQVEQLLATDRRLTDDERLFILEHYQEGANNNNAAMGAFFTPQGLARDLAALDVPSGCDTIVDLCAGIGSLSFWAEHHAQHMVCVEQCADYVRVGKKVMPDATWIHADVFSDWTHDFDGFDFAISNPPFGNRIKASGFSGLYTGQNFEYKVIELASRIADCGAFIVPQSSAPFRYSGFRRYEERVGADCEKFMRQTGITLAFATGVDTAYYRDQWHGVAPICEIVVCDFEKLAHGAAAHPNVCMTAPVSPYVRIDVASLESS